MYNHQQKDYQCPFCAFLQGEETEYKSKDDIVFEDDKILAFISPKWWVNNPGHVVIIPKKHIENIYTISNALLSHLHIVAKQMAIALKETYHCDGTYIRQQNEPAGGQSVWHFHIHVYPRYANDKLYARHEERKYVSSEKRKPYADKLKAYFK